MVVDRVTVLYNPMLLLYEIKTYMAEGTFIGLKFIPGLKKRWGHTLHTVCPYPLAEYSAEPRSVV